MQRHGGSRSGICHTDTCANYHILVPITTFANLSDSTVGGRFLGPA